MILTYIPIIGMFLYVICAPSKIEDKKNIDLNEGKSKGLTFQKILKSEEKTKKKSSKEDKTIFKSESSKKEVDTIKQEKDMTKDHDYEVIFTYISDTYKKISKEDAKKIAHYLVKHGRDHNLDPKLAAALIARESGFDKDAVSVTGARGLGQIKDFNYPSLGILDPHDIQENVVGTVKYLKRLFKRWDLEKLVEVEKKFYPRSDKELGSDGKIFQIEDSKKQKNKENVPFFSQVQGKVDIEKINDDTKDVMKIGKTLVRNVVSKGTAFVSDMKDLLPKDKTIRKSLDLKSIPNSSEENETAKENSNLVDEVSLKDFVLLKKVKFALGSYYRGATSITNGGFDVKTKRYIDDILANYGNLLEKHDRLNRDASE